MPEDYYHIIDLVVWANENASTFQLDSVVKDQARAVFAAGGKNEDSSIGLKAVNDVLSKRLTGIYFVYLQVPSLQALNVFDSDGTSAESRGGLYRYWQGHSIGYRHSKRLHQGIP